MELKFEVHARIEKPVEEVFSAVYEPQQLKQYFANKSASAPLKEGTTVFWEFSDCGSGKIPVKVKKVVPNKLITFEWENSEGGYDTHVEIVFEALDTRSTLVRISESGWHENQKGLGSSYGNCWGWTQMLCCLKTYLEHGINLREGFFVHEASKAA